MRLREKKDQERSSNRRNQIGTEIDLRELELIIFLKEELQITELI